MRRCQDQSQAVYSFSNGQPAFMTVYGFCNHTPNSHLACSVRKLKLAASNTTVDYSVLGAASAAAAECKAIEHCVRARVQMGQMCQAVYNSR